MFQTVSLLLRWKPNIGIHKVSEKRPLLCFTPLINQIKINTINQLLSRK